MFMSSKQNFYTILFSAVSIVSLIMYITNIYPYMRKYGIIFLLLVILGTISILITCIRMKIPVKFVTALSIITIFNFGIFIIFYYKEISETFYLVMNS